VEVLPAVGARLARVRAPEKIEELLVGELIRVVVNRDRFRVVADCPVGGVQAGSTAVTDARSDDSWEGSELGIRSPKSAEAEGGRLELCPREFRIKREAISIGAAVFNG
jgi:hypothetical protein